MVNRRQDWFLEESKRPENSQKSKEDTVPNLENVPCVLRAWCVGFAFEYFFEDSNYSWRVDGHEDPECTNDNGGKAILLIEVWRDVLCCCFIYWQESAI